MVTVRMWMENSNCRVYLSVLDWK